MHSRVRSHAYLKTRARLWCRGDMLCAWAPHATYGYPNAGARACRYAFPRARRVLLSPLMLPDAQRRSKMLALELLLSVMEHPGDAFRRGPRFVRATKVPPRHRGRGGRRRRAE